MLINTKLSSNHAFQPFLPCGNGKLDKKSRRVAARMENFCAPVVAATHIFPGFAMGDVA